MRLKAVQPVRQHQIEQVSQHRLISLSLPVLPLRRVSLLAVRTALRLVRLILLQLKQKQVGQIRLITRQ